MEVCIPGFDIALTADSGQCFRFEPLGGDVWQVIAGGRLLRLRDLGGGRFDFDCDGDSFDAFWRGYFDLERDYGAVARSVPADDAFLTAACRYAGGLRILRQEPFETLICFIISQRKSIPAIRRCVRALCDGFGRPLEGGLRAFPAPGALAEAGLEGLDACGLGYRSRYVLHTARLIAGGQVDLSALALLDDAALLERLMALPGVGVKVASCVMLFGYHRVDAFPRDVWIERVIDRQYGGRFPLEHYAGHAGIIQQYMFCYARGPWRPGAPGMAEGRPQASEPPRGARVPAGRKAGR